MSAQRLPNAAGRGTMNFRRPLVLLLLICAFASPAPVLGRDGLDIHFFYGHGCPHCKKEEVFLKECAEKYGALRIHRYEVYFDTGNMDFFETVATHLGATATAVPFLVIGREYIVGFDPTITPDMVRFEIEKCLPGRCPDIVQALRNARTGTTPRAGPLPDEGGKTPAASAQRRKILTIPLLGDIDVFTFSLPVLTVVMGFLDGFNPCAMWALIFLIGLLLGMRNRARMWLLGTAFIAASAFVYFLFMAAWLNIILFFGLLVWVRVGIGLIALAGGVFSIWDVLSSKEISCKMNGDDRRREFRIRLRKVIGQHSLLLSLAGIALLAFMVNLVELVCSAGFPAIYTQVLSLNALPAWKYYAYILLYILFFMIDDMFVFAAAMLTLEVTGATTTYVRWARLLGGVLMLLVGTLLIFRPQWLMFG